MIIESCLIAITAMLLILVLFLVSTIAKVNRSINLFQSELSKASEETTQLLRNLNHLVQDDIHRFSQESTSLLSKVNHLTEGIKGKAETFAPLASFISSKFSHKDNNTLPQFLKWCALSVTLFKTTRRLVNYVK